MPDAGVKIGLMGTRANTPPHCRSAPQRVRCQAACIHKIRRTAALAMMTLCARSAFADRPASIDQCMDYSPPVPAVFDETVATAASQPECWQQLQRDLPVLFLTQQPPQQQQQPQQHATEDFVLFLHGMTSPAGHVRLVCLVAARAANGMQITPMVIDSTQSPPTASTPLGSIQVVNHLDLPLKVHFGIADPKDASRVWMAVDYHGKTQKIGWQLLDDDTITMTPPFGWMDSGGNWQVEDAPNHIQIKQPIKIMQLGYGKRIDGVGSLLSKHGNLLVIRSDNAKGHSQLDLWDTQTQKLITSWDAGGGFNWPRFSDDGTSITGFENGERIYYRFAIPTGRQMWRIDLSEVFTRPNSAHSFYMDGNRVAISSPDEGLVRIWDIKAHGQLLKRIHVPVEGQQNLTVSEDGRVMAFWQFAPHTKVLFFSPETGRIISQQAVNPSVEEFGFTADDRDFIEITDDGLVFVDVASGKIDFRRGSGPLWRDAKISTSCNAIISPAQAGVYSLPSADTYHELTLNGQPISSNSVTVSGDGTRAVTLLEDGTWALWNLTENK